MFYELEPNLNLCKKDQSVLDKIRFDFILIVRVTLGLERTAGQLTIGIFWV